MLVQVNDKIFIDVDEIQHFEIDPEDGMGRIEYFGKGGATFVDAKLANTIKQYLEDWIGRKPANQKLMKVK